MVVACSLGNLFAQCVRGLASPGTSDFAAGITGGMLAGHGSELYSVERQVQLQQSLFAGYGSGAPPRLYPFVDPPMVAYAFAPFARFDPAFGVKLFFAASALAVLCAAVLLKRCTPQSLGERQRILWTVSAVATIPASNVFAENQIDGFLLLAAALSLCAFRAGRPLTAGLLLSLLLAKPQLIWILPIAALAGQEWRLLGGFVMGATGVLLLNFLAIGMAGVRAWISLLSRWTDIEVHLADNVAGVLSNRIGFIAAAVLGFVVSLVAIALVVRRLQSEVAIFGWGIGLSLVFAPHLYSYDLLMASVPLTVALGVSRPVKLWSTVIAIDVAAIPPTMPWAGWVFAAALPLTMARRPLGRERDSDRTQPVVAAPTTHPGR